jgi:DNA-binding transcriptional MerR regulator
MTMIEDNIRHLPRLRIGEAMKLFDMTARAIRYYEERGLIDARRDRMNSRYYDQTARRRLDWIRQLRGAGLGLRDIQDVIEADEQDGSGNAVAMDRLQARRTAVEEDLAGIDAAIARLSTPRPGAARPLLRKS